MTPLVWIALMFVAASIAVLVRVARRPKQMNAIVVAPTPAGELQAPPPPRPAPMRVMAMSSRGFLRIDRGNGPLDEALPESPLGRGEYPAALWVAPDGEVFVAGKQYTGQPGPDYGVIWRRTPDGSWSMPLRLPDRVLMWIAGRSRDEVVAGTVGGIVCFDGSEWRDVPLPYAKMWKVWRDGDDIVAQAFDDSLAFIVEHGEPRPCPPRTTYNVDQAVAILGDVSYRAIVESKEIGERTLSPEEDAEIRGELEQVRKALAARGEQL